MKKQILSLVSLLVIGLSAHATTFYVTNSGNNYSPASITINLGDTVYFVPTASHTTRQVSQSTWMANDTAALGGGFNNLATGSFIVPTSTGMIYYVCVEHVIMNGMKGTINVSSVGIESNNALTLQIVQSTFEQELKLMVSGGLSCQLYVEMMNLSGQSVRKLTMNLTGDETSAIIEVGDLPKGIYMIRWSYANINKAKKIILQ